MKKYDLQVHKYKNLLNREFHADRPYAWGVNPQFRIYSGWQPEKSGCRLFGNITPVGADVKGCGAVHLALDPVRLVLLGHRLGEVDGHLGVDQALALSLSGSLLGNIHHGQYSICSRLSLVGNTDLTLVTLRSWWLKPSMALAECAARNTFRCQEK